MLFSSELSFLSFASGEIRGESHRAWYRLTAHDDRGDTCTLFASPKIDNRSIDVLQSAQLGDRLIVTVDLVPSFDGRSFRASLCSLHFSEKGGSGV